MALTAEDLAQIKELFAGQAAPAPAAPEPVSPDPAPAEFYVHLADGRVIQTADSASTHIDGVQVIGRYAMSDDAKEAAANE
jgi:hypothetical protein